jgi:site-specific DNA recombinase
VRIGLTAPLRLVIPGPAQIDVITSQRDEKLIALVAEAREARRLILGEPNKSIASIARDVGKCRTRLTKIAALACMAPDIITAIVEGRQPPSLSRHTLLAADLPLSWQDQRITLGFV